MTEKSPHVSTRTKVAATNKTAERPQAKRLAEINCFARELIATGRWPVDAQDVLVSTLNHLDNQTGDEKEVLMSALGRCETLASIAQDEPRRQHINQLFAVREELGEQDEKLENTRTLLMAFQYAARQEAEYPDLRGSLYWPVLIATIEQSLPKLDELELCIRKAVQQVDIARPDVVFAQQNEPTRRREALSTLADQQA